MRRNALLTFLILIVAALSVAAAGCGGEDDEGGGGGGGGGGGAAAEAADNQIQALPSASCQAPEYEGDGEADVIVASDLPMQGSSRTQTVQMVEAIRFVLNQRQWKAGDLDVAYQVCDDSTAQAGKWDTAKCSQNANAYAQNADVMAVIGTFNSGCAAIEIPILNQAPEGGIAMISPANTFVCLTESGPGCAKTEPDKYYPTGTRNYARVVAHDAYQGAAVAQFMQDIGVESVFVLNDKEAYGLGVAQNLRNAAQSLGIKIAGFTSWDPKAANYEALMQKVEASGAQALFLGGLIDENGAKLIKDKVSVLGPNPAKPGQGVVLLAPDGFTTQATIDEAGKASRGMFSSVAGVPADQLKGAGKEFIDAFKQETGEETIEPYTSYAAQSATIVLDAIENSDGTRAGVIEQMMTYSTDGGIVADSFEITENGDPTVGPVTIYVAKKSFETHKVITPESSLVEAAKAAS